MSNETLNGTVSKFVPGSTTASVTLKGLDSPLGLAFDSSGDLFVANFGGSTVSEFAPGATVPTATLTGLNAPIALAFDANGNLYVANLNGNTVSKFAPGSTIPTATLTGLSEPAALEFGPNGNLYVVNRTGNTVSEFTPGSLTPQVTLTGLDSPRRLAFDASGDLFVVNNDNNTVSEFAPGGLTAHRHSYTGLDVPHGIAFDSFGNLYVVNQGNNTVSRFGASATAQVFVTTSSGILNYTANSGPKAIDPALTLTDTESTTIASATVTISSGYVSGEDVLGFASQNGISGTVIGNKLTLSGTASVSRLSVGVLASVTYTDTQSDASTASRTVSFIVNDGTNSSNTATKTISPQPTVVLGPLPISTIPSATLTGLDDPGPHASIRLRSATCSSSMSSPVNSISEFALGEHDSHGHLNGADQACGVGLRFQRESFRRQQNRQHGVGIRPRRHGSPRRPSRGSIALLP